ncbi:3'-5' exoribonuclease [Hoyosella rhizosphaerae]|uniref:DNA polymerase III subunit epsilon n=1 Tax=Hoyosella rhizosphaerae TaxID=1755582 RepID=A0A916XII2_9ACTN|nr:exonuclease domain-containing protein [Hoyosella rhizosphaerae]MBN4928335.1 3'-5' exoribonuclease [Hoyosella rhizosphaerae]GGC74157.1 DNA polymerase III subunit epsilon [Hoyosella rhizosphaerae]
MTNGLNFVALDVETANNQRGSICAIGGAIVEDGKLTGTFGTYCKPPEGLDHFSPFNTMIHGITAVTVANEPQFNDVMAEVVQLIGDRTVIAHNAGFDIGALRSACTHGGVTWPEWQYGCTLVWSRRILDLISYRLPIVAESLGIVIENHHDPVADAIASAEIAIKLAERTNSSTIAELTDATTTRLGLMQPGNWRGCETIHSGSSSQPEFAGANPDADPNNPLFGHRFAFTGALSITRQEAWNLAGHAGAIAEKSVTKKTTRLVVGDDFSGESLEEFQTKKANKAFMLRAQGQPIEVLTEQDFYELLAQTE